MSAPTHTPSGHGKPTAFFRADVIVLRRRDGSVVYLSNEEARVVTDLLRFGGFATQQSEAHLATHADLSRKAE